MNAHNSLPSNLGPSNLGDDQQWKVGRLASPLPTFHATMTCAEAYERFNETNTQIAAAIVDGENRVLGLINRLRFLARYAQRYAPELYANRPVLKFANPTPLIVDHDMSLVEFGPTITLDWPDALRECFVVTRGNTYFGIGTAEALVRCKFELLLQREMQLESALINARTASQAKTNFLALMSHELRTPLNAIIGFSDILATELLGSHAVEKYREYSADINGAGRHLLELINNILDLSKLEAGKFELNTSVFNPVELVEDCCRLVSVPARQQDVAIDVQTANPPVLLDADRLRVKQIILNLLSNAIKFTPAGGKVSVRVELAVDGALCVVIQDTGIGMAPEMIPVVFEPFRQIQSPFARDVQGTGLGLSLVKALAELHGGSVEMDSAANLGTTVSVRFPPARSVPA